MLLQVTHRHQSLCTLFLLAAIPLDYMLVTSTEWSCCMELPLVLSEFLLQTLLKHFPAVQTARSPSVTSQLPENRDSISQDRL